MARQNELFDPRTYISKKTYITHSEAYLPLRKHEVKALREPFQVRLKELKELEESHRKEQEK